MIITRWFLFHSPPKTGCTWFKRILQLHRIQTSGEATIGCYELTDPHVPRLPTITIRRDPADWLKSYRFNFSGGRKRDHWPTVGFFVGRDPTLADVENVFQAYPADVVIDLDNDPAGQVIRIFKQLRVPNLDAEGIRNYKPMNVTKYPEGYRDPYTLV